MKLLLALQTKNVDQVKEVLPLVSNVSLDIMYTVFAYEVTHPVYVLFIGWLQTHNIKIDVSSVTKVQVKSLLRCIKLNLLPKCLPLSFIQHCEDDLVEVLAMNGYTFELSDQVDTRSLDLFIKYQPDNMYYQYTDYLSINQLQHHQTGKLGASFDSIIQQVNEVVSRVVQEQSCPQLHTIVQPFIGCHPNHKLQC